jgi:hypothetical protein
MRTNTTEPNTEEKMQVNGGGASGKAETSTVNKNIMNSVN